MDKALRIFIALWLLIAAPTLDVKGQILSPILQQAPISATSFVTTVTANNGASTTSVVTSPSVTLTGDNMVIGNCSSASSTLTYTASDSVSDTVTTITTTHNGSNTQSIAGFYILHPSAGSLTFTCTQTGTSAFLAVFVAVFNRGPLTAFDTSVQSIEGSNSNTHTSPSFSTSAGGLITYFGGGFGAGSGAVTLGNIGSTAMASMYNDGQSAWGYTLPLTSQSTITATMTSTNSLRFMTAMLAFK